MRERLTDTASTGPRPGKISDNTAQIIADEIAKLDRSIAKYQSDTRVAMVAYLGAIAEGTKVFQQRQAMAKELGEAASPDFKPELRGGAYTAPVMEKNRFLLENDPFPKPGRPLSGTVSSALSPYDNNSDF